MCTALSYTIERVERTRTPRVDLGTALDVITVRARERRGAVVFFFQAEDGIRDLTVTGVQTCALPISQIAALRKPGLWLQEVSVPDLGPNDLLIKVRKAAICGTDIHIFNWDAWSQKTIDRKSVV